MKKIVEFPSRKAGAAGQQIHVTQHGPAGGKKRAGQENVVTHSIGARTSGRGSASSASPSPKGARAANTLVSPKILVPHAKDTPIPAKGRRSATQVLSPMANVPNATNSVPSARKARAAVHPVPPGKSLPLAKQPADEAGGLGRKTSVTHNNGVEPDISPRKAGGRGQAPRVTHVQRVPADLIKTIIGINREHRMLIAGHGDMVRRVKSMERWVAFTRCKTLGLEIPKGKFPEVIEQDKAMVRELFPRIIAGEKFAHDLRKDAEKHLLEGVRLFPSRVLDFVASVRGFGLPGLGMVVGESGDLSNYSNPAKLWKRFSLHCVDDRASKRVRGEGAEAEEFVPERRAIAHIVGESLLKAGGRYANLYRERKAYEVAKVERLGLEVRPAAKIPKNRQYDFMSEGQIHKRALRFIEKRLLRELWRVWNGYEPTQGMEEA